MYTHGQCFKCLITFPTWGYKKFFSPHTKKMAQKQSHMTQNLHIGPHICLSGLFGDRPDQTNANKVPRCYRDTKSFAPSQTN